MTRDLSPEERRSSRFLLLAVGVIAVASLFIIWPFLTGTIFACVVAYLLHKPFLRLAKAVRSRALAATLLTLLVILAVVLPIVAMAWQLVQEGRALFADGGGGEYVDGIVATLTRFGMDEVQARSVLDDALAQLANVAKAGALPTLGVIASLLANLGIFVFLLYFLLVGGEALMALVRRALPLEEARREHLLATAGQRVRALFLGTFLVALVQGVVAGVGWWLFGLPSPIFWGFVMTILAVIPAVGPILVLAPAGIVLLVQGQTFAGIGIIAYGLVVVGLVDNLVRPFIIGRTSDVHPGVVLLGTLGGLSVFGATGFIVGPLILSLFGPLLAEWEAIRPGPG